MNYIIVISIISFAIIITFVICYERYKKCLFITIEDLNRISAKKQHSTSDDSVNSNLISTKEIKQKKAHYKRNSIENSPPKQSMISKIRECILQANRPLHINEIIDLLEKISKIKGKKASIAYRKKLILNKNSILSMLNLYNKREKVFIKTAPSTFWLREL